MLAVFVWEDIFQSPTVVTEALLLGLIIALIGAGGFILFGFSMKDDRADKRMERVYNPWQQLSNEEDNTPPKKDRRNLKTVLFILLAVLIVLICLFLAVKFGWI